MAKKNNTEEQTPSTEVALFGAQTEGNLPVADYGEAAGMGNENVGAGDMAIPQLKIVESNSAAISDGLDGAKPGTIQNSITNEFFESVLVIPLRYEIKYTVWKKRDLGGGIEGSFPTLQEAAEHIETLQGGASAYDAVETATHAMLVLDDEGNVLHPALMHFSGTRLTASRQWNSAIETKHPKNAPRFAGVWRLFPEKRTNTKGTWYVPGYDFMGLAPKPLYDAAYEMYQAIVSEKAAA